MGSLLPRSRVCAEGWLGGPVGAPRPGGGTDVLSKPVEAPQHLGLVWDHVEAPHQVSLNGKWKTGLHSVPSLNVCTGELPPHCGHSLVTLCL